MPVKPERQKLYPGGSLKSPEWLAIRERIRNRAGDRCEGCGVRNRRMVLRSIDGVHYRYVHVYEGLIQQRAGIVRRLRMFTGNKGLVRMRIVDELPGDGDIDWCGRPIQIVCTTAHINHDPADNRDDNLKFWCQRCHNRHDAAHRQANAARTRRLSNQEFLFEHSGPGYSGKPKEEDDDR